MKSCTKCGTDKPESEFAVSRNSADGLFRWCRQCWNEHRRNKYAGDPKPFKIAQQKWKSKRNDDLGNCIWCDSPAIRTVKLVPNGTSLPTCGCRPALVTTIGRLPKNHADRILSLLSKSDIEGLKASLADEAKCLKIVFDAVKRLNGHNGSPKHIEKEEEP